MNISLDPTAPPDAAFPTRVPVTAASIAAYVADSIAVKQQLLADTALLAKIADVVSLCIATYRAGGKILVGGNGGSAADAQHLAAELVARFEYDRPGLPAMSLSTDTSALTAIGNDYGYEFLFARQLQALARPGDLFIGITTSGNSKNVLKAFDVAPKLGVTRIALCGSCGKAKDIAEHALCVPSAHTPRIQECHILIIHILCALLEENLFPEHKAPKPAVL
ncbi:D-sedoheptulose 7-phosphate isomerase [Nevskia ramosa]|uniref:D-sedoheptulose 7-phosphate isomerase n=1 Tax=Nevskia ramosa TaxID=64002 RepID=UPI00235605CF|nr:D-sedoheptulose 7-phosphate isomerase [Nevskia ramosa]